MPAQTTFFIYSFWIVIASIIGSVVFLWLFFIGGKRYTVEDTEAHAEEFAETIKEGHGKMTIFLWVSFAALFIWAVVYLVMNWQQFYVLFASTIR
jgi:hypothetical protein